MGWGGLGWAELGWGGEGGINYIQEGFRKVFARCFFHGIFTPESLFAVAIVSGKLIGTSPTVFTAQVYTKCVEYLEARYSTKVA